MKAGPDNNPSQDTPFDENDALWRLMGRAPMPEPDAWFAARTLARCRTEVKTSVVRLGLVWRWALGGGLGICLALVFMLVQIHSEQVDKQKNVQEAFEIMASIEPDADSSSSSTSSWQDSSL